MTVIDFITVLGFTITVLSAGITIGKILSDHNKNDRPHNPTKD